MQDRRELLALRREVASSLAKQLCQSDMNGTAPLHVVSADGYRVFRIGMGWAELLLAVRGTMGDLEVRYAYLNEREEEPVLCKMRLREPEISLGALGNAGC